MTNPRLKQAKKNDADIFESIFYGVPIEVLLQKNTENIKQNMVLQLHFKLGLPLNQIAETINLTIKQVKAIVNHPDIIVSTNTSMVLYFHAIGLSLTQIAKTMNLSIKEVQIIVNQSSSVKN